MHVPTKRIMDNPYEGASYVPGTGPVPCDWLFLGEAPGKDEDRTGKPFVGRSGKRLWSVLDMTLDLSRETVHVDNIVPYRPPGNRDPYVKEIKLFLPRLEAVLAEVKPKVVVTLGRIPTAVFEKGVRLTAEHGKARLATFGSWTGVVVPWYHPAYTLRNSWALGVMLEDGKRLVKEVNNVRKRRVATTYTLETGFPAGNSSPIGVDTETTSPTRAGIFVTDEAQMVGYSVSAAPSTGAYVPCQVLDGPMREALEDEATVKICHNSKFELKVFKRLGVEMVNYEDTMVAAYVLGEQSVSLKDLTRQVLGISPITYKQATNGRDMSELLPEEIKDYAAADSDHTLQLWKKFKERLEIEGLWEIYQDIEMPLVPVLAEMEARGAKLDLTHTNSLSFELRAAANTHGESARGASGDPNININSDAQLEKLLVAKGVPLRKLTKGRSRYSVDAEVLKSIESHWPEFITPLLNYRKYRKLAQYITSWLALVADDGRLHPSFNQAATYDESGGESRRAPSTGRISVSGPNLSNIPHHRAFVNGVNWGDKMRDCLVAEDGCVLMSADLAQEEPRIIAIVANDETLLTAFQEGRDIYRSATEALYSYAILSIRNGNTISPAPDKEWAAEFPEERFAGKTFFLAWYYGGGAGTLASIDPTISRETIQKGIERLAEAHPARERYLESVRKETELYGYVSTLYGRRRNIPEIYSTEVKVAEEGLRMAANAKVQGTAADILKLAMRLIRNKLLCEGFRARMVNTVHDEVVLEVPRSEIDDVADIIKRSFRDLLPGLELIVEVNVGERWGSQTRL